MVDSVQQVSFRDKNIIKKMPIRIESNNIKFTFFLFFFAIILGASPFYDGSLNTVRHEFIEKWVSFFVFFSLILIFFLVYMIKEGAFIMAADEKGIYYRIYGKKDIFILIEWRIIVEVVEKYSDGSDYLVVKTMIKNYCLPRLCNAVTYESRTTKAVNISFIIPQSFKRPNIKSRLDGLKVKSQNAMLA